MKEERKKATFSHYLLAHPAADNFCDLRMRHNLSIKLIETTVSTLPNKGKVFTLSSIFFFANYTAADGLVDEAGETCQKLKNKTWRYQRLKNKI